MGSQFLVTGPFRDKKMSSDRSGAGHTKVAYDIGSLKMPRDGLSIRLEKYCFRSGFMNGRNYSRNSIATERKKRICFQKTAVLLFILPE